MVRFELPRSERGDHFKYLIGEPSDIQDVRTFGSLRGLVRQDVQANQASFRIPLPEFRPLGHQRSSPGSAASSVSLRDGLTPAAVSVTPIPPSPGTVPALLLVSPRAVPSIQILPVLTDNIPVSVSVQADPVVLPAGGGPGRGTIRITANAVSATTLASIPVSVPFQFVPGTVPADLMLDTLSGTTPATINVTGQFDSLPPGGASVEQLNLAVGSESQRVLVFLSRPGPPLLVNPTSLQLGGPLRQALQRAVCRSVRPTIQLRFRYSPSRPASACLRRPGPDRRC